MPGYTDSAHVKQLSGKVVDIITTPGRSAQPDQGAVINFFDQRILPDIRREGSASISRTSLRPRYHVAWLTLRLLARGSDLLCFFWQLVDESFRDQLDTITGF